MNRGWTLLTIGILLGLLVGREAVESATKVLVDTDSPQTLSNKTIVGVIPPGAIFAYGGSSAPPGFLLCDGSTVSRTAYPELFAAIGTSWGAGETTFNLPDLRGRSPLGSGQGSGGLTSRALGTSGGEETHTLTIAEMPSHNHDWAWQYTQGSGPDIAFTNVGGGYGRHTDSTGGGQAHNILDPFAVTNFIIKT